MSNILLGTAKKFPEIVITLASLLVMLLLALCFDLPIMMPSGEAAGFVGIHYIYPLVGVGILGGITFFAGRMDIATRFMIALPCYVGILFAHFNIKLWIPHVNPLLYDAQYWYIDSYMHVIVDLCMKIRMTLFFFIPYEANFYMISYIMMFYGSFCYHALRTPEIFGRVTVAALLVQAFGTLGYLVAPAIGPFLYEPGLNPMINGGQASMLEFYQQSVAHGPQWLARNGGANFTIGLAAMPSLHSASAFLFFLFALRHGRVLLPLYGFILAYILIMAVASRWHYLIDIPVGMGIAWVSYMLAEWFDRPSRASSMAVEQDFADPAIA